MKEDIFTRIQNMFHLRTRPDGIYLTSFTYENAPVTLAQIITYACELTLKSVTDTADEVRKLNPAEMLEKKFN